MEFWFGSIRVTSQRYSELAGVKQFGDREEYNGEWQTPKRETRFWSKGQVVGSLAEKVINVTAYGYDKNEWVTPYQGY